MRPGARVLVLAGVVLAAHVATVLAAPRLLHAVVSARIVRQALGAPALGAEVRARGAVNVALHAPPADAASRSVVRPSPDLLYTACVFDLRDGVALRVTGPVADGYASLAAFAANTDNFFAQNDAQLAAAGGARRFDIVLAREAPASLPAGARLVIAPGASGLVLFRTLVADAGALPALRALQAQQRCEPLS